MTPPLPRRAFLVRAVGVAVAVTTMGPGGLTPVAAVPIPADEWSAPMSEAEMLDVVSMFVPGQGRYKYEGGVYTRWYGHGRLLKLLRGVFPQVPLLQPFLLVQRQSDSEFVEIQRVVA